MNQQKFTWTLKHSKSKEVYQDKDGITTAVLRDNIILYHDYHRRNRIEIFLKDKNLKYIIPSHVELNEILTIHLSHQYADQLIYEYCEKYLEKCKQ